MWGPSKHAARGSFALRDQKNARITQQQNEVMLPGFCSIRLYSSYILPVVRNIPRDSDQVVKHK